MRPLKDTFGLEAMRSELIRDEGEVLHVYKDPGSGRAIGVGRNLDTQGISAAELAFIGTTLDIILEEGISHDIAVILLDDDISDRAHQLDVKLPWWRLLSPARQRVLVNMAFEMGTRGMTEKQETAITAIAQGNFADAADAMLASPWGTGKTHNRALRLARQLVSDRAVTE